MMSTYKELMFGSEGRQSLAKGVETLAKAVAVTLGPKGRNVLIEQPYGIPKITKDGVTVAKSIVLQNKFENLGARLVQDVATKTNETAGDGTTTATVLTHAIFKEGLKNVAAGCSPTDLRRGVQQAVDHVVMYLKQNSRSITSGDEIKQVATISANGDEEVGKMIAMAMEKVGKEGVITVQEGKTLVDQLEIIEGMKLDRGFISPYFITDPKSQKVEFHQPYILLTEKKISLVQDILPALELAAQQRRPLLIIAEDIDGEAMSLCIVNKLRGQVQVCAIKAPGFGEQRQALLQDIAILCDGKVLNDENGLKFDQITVNELGKAGSITITKEDTIILHGGATDASTSSSSSSNTSSSMNTSNKEKLNERIECIRSAIQTTTSEYEKEKLQERLAKLSGGVAVIKVGGASEVEVGEKKDRFVDALNATRAAVEEGIVPGGGIALLKSSLTLNQLKFKNEDQRLGIQLIQKALQAPTKTLVDNAGGVSGAYVVGKLVDSTLNENQPFGMGYDAVHGIYTDMIQAGIVDPLKVVRTALVDAAGVASLLTTSECLVVDAPSVKSEPNASSSNVGGGAPGGMMGGGGMGF